MKVGRNDPCPCGSRKKYKHCCKDRIEAIERLEFAQKGLLYLPKSSIAHKPIVARSKELDYISVYLTSKELTHKTPAISDLQVILKDLNKKDGLCFFSLINMILANDGFSNSKLQVELIKLFFPANIISAISTYRKNEKIIVFTELQITTILKLLCLYGCDDNNGVTIDKIERTSKLSDIFLVTNDLITEHNENDANKSETKKEVIDNFLKTLMSSHWYANHEKIAFAIPRYYLIYNDIFESPEVKSHELYCDIHAIFKEATGLELKAYIGFLIGIHAQFLAQSIIKNSVDFKRITISKRTYFKDVNISNEQKDKLFNALVIKESDLRSSLTQEAGSGSSFYLDNMTLMAKPFIQIDDDQLICSNLSFLLSKITSGIFWQLFDYIKSKGKDPKIISRFFGVLFERYVRMAFERIRGASDLKSVNTVYLPKKYIGREGTEEESTDIILEYPETLIFIEVVSSRLKLRETIIEGDITSFWSDLDKMVVEKARQLQRKIEDYKNNLFEVGGKLYSNSNIKGFYAIIIGLEGFPYWPTVREELDEKLSAANLLQSKDDIKGWDFIDVEELEYLEPVLEAESMLVVLEEKLSHPELKHMAIKNFLFQTNRLMGNNEYLAKIRDRTFKQIQRDLFSAKSIAI